MTDRERELEAEVARLKAQLDEAIRIAGDALGTDPALRSVGCVQALADWHKQTQAEVKRLNQEIGNLQDALQLELGESAPLRERVKALEALCLRAAFYIGVRQGPEVDVEADELLKELRGET